MIDNNLYITSVFLINLKIINSHYRNIEIEGVLYTRTGKSCFHEKKARTFLVLCKLLPPTMSESHWFNTLQVIRVKT